MEAGSAERRPGEKATSNSERTNLWRACIDPLEVLEDRAALIGGQTAQFVPCRLTELDGRLAARVGVVRPKLIPAFGRCRLTLVRVLPLFFLQRAARVEQTAEQLLLTRQ